MEKNADKNPYAIMEVEKNCDVETLKKQFKKLALLYHPDKSKHRLLKEKNIDFITLIWAYEQILKKLKSSNKSEKYENALDISTKDLKYIKEEETYIYFCRCGDFFIFSENLYYEYYVIHVCQSCSSSVYIIP